MTDRMHPVQRANLRDIPIVDKEGSEGANRDSRTCETGWQPIETAPKNGTPVLCWIPSDDGGFAYVCRWERFGNEAARQRHGSEGAWYEAGGEENWMLSPTHWMPLPPAPEPHP